MGKSRQPEQLIAIKLANRWEEQSLLCSKKRPGQKQNLIEQVSFKVSDKIQSSNVFICYCRQEEGVSC